MNIIWNRTLTTILFFLLGSTLIARAEEPASDWKSVLLASLKENYQITTRNFLGKIQKPGTVLVIMKDGLQADEPKAMMKPTIIENGEITKSGAGSVVTGWGGRSLPIGEKAYVYDVRVSEEYVLLMIATIKTTDIIRNQKTKAVPEQAAISFRLKDLATATPESVIAAIKPWLITETEAASAKTVSLGQTIEEVERNLGKPSKIANLGSKSIFYYADMKVVFVDGKVSDVQ